MSKSNLNLPFFILLLATLSASGLTKAMTVTLPSGETRQVPDRTPSQSEEAYRRYLQLYFGVSLPTEPEQQQLKELREKQFKQYQAGLQNRRPEDAARMKALLGQAIVVDTRDAKSCAEIRSELEQKLPAQGHLSGSQSLRDLCMPDPDRPYSTIMVFRDSLVDKDEFSQVIYSFDNRTIEHINNMRNVAILQLAAFGRLLASPASETHWQKHDGRNAPKRWADNVSHAPVFDKDNFRTNFIEHPFSGSIYYTIARHSGFSPLESFGFSVFVSTFMWEYGMEAAYEKPSIQDLIATPVIGSLLGEVFFQIDKAIRKNDGKVLGNRSLGAAIQFITNPGYYLSQGLNEALGKPMVQEGDIRWEVVNSPRLPMAPYEPQHSGYALMLKLNIRL